jgi:cellulose synthase/poly-beta-1,6-N-acetylglucosamine synthase-like glycosyltransferase
MISVVVPTYNEAENLPELLERLDRALAGRSYEVVVVDDGSPDGTAEVARWLAGRYPVRVLVREGRRGLSSAVVEGPGPQGRRGGGHGRRLSTSAGHLFTTFTQTPCLNPRLGEAVERCGRWRP